MALRDLFFSIVAKDETGAAFASVKRKMAETEGAARGMRDRMRGAGNAAVSFGKKASVASAGVALLFRDSLRLYDTQAKAEAKVAQAIKATGGAAGFTAGELKKEASALQGTSRFGDEDILNNVTAQLFAEITRRVDGALVARTGEYPSISTALDHLGPVFEFIETVE